MRTYLYHMTLITTCITCFNLCSVTHKKHGGYAETIRLYTLPSQPKQLQCLPPHNPCSQDVDNAVNMLRTYNIDDELAHSYIQREIISHSTNGSYSQQQCNELLTRLKHMHINGHNFVTHLDTKTVDNAIMDMTYQQIPYNVQLTKLHEDISSLQRRYGYTHFVVKSWLQFAQQRAQLSNMERNNNSQP